ncbi:MAG: SDR family oxidoreductase [Anaerolineae bacterium]|nr:SDR family oxidoreductase [Anaerolineae bacterium]
MPAQEGKVAIVTGAGRRGGIGAAIARRLAREGVHVVLGDLCAPPTDLSHGGNPDWEELQAVAAEVEGLGVRALPVRVDVTDAESVQEMGATVQRAFGRLDILVNNAGVVVDPAPVMLMDERAWRRTLEVNATGTFLCCKHALPLMVEGEQGGAVVNVSSIAAIRPRIYMSAYAASKAAIIALTQSLAQEVAPFGIRVNAVLPGDVDTAMKRWGMELEARITGRTYEEVVDDLAKRIPLGRLATPEDVADVVAFLASEQARFITGQAWNVSGGRELT